MAEPGTTPSIRDLLAGYAAVGRRGAVSVRIALAPPDEALGQLHAAGQRRHEGVAMLLFGVST